MSVRYRLLRAWAFWSDFLDGIRESYLADERARAILNGDSPPRPVAQERAMAETGEQLGGDGRQYVQPNVTAENASQLALWREYWRLLVIMETAADVSPPATGGTDG